mmetsp:Transcript_53327/g.114580  ORF Transcript_53327/g.114580 Transcript_53327/m.114580 type:complete len:358 (+) Transcript_53327:70-1143(+)
MATPEPGDGTAEVAAGEAAMPREGDHVILWGGYSNISGVVLKSGAITNNRFGAFHHDDLLAQPYGSKVRTRKGGQWMAMLRQSPELITQSLLHRTQIIYHADISLLIALLDARPGRVLCEAGTGSGSVSTSLARALRPGGRLHTFEFHADRQRQAAADFARYGLEDTIVSRHGDVCKDGFGAALGEGAVDGIFLDLPAPWLAIPHADRCLVGGGRIVTFSPCIEQIEKTAAEFRRGGRYQNVRLFETLAVNWGVKEEEARPAKQRRKGPVASAPAAPDGGPEAAAAVAAPAPLAQSWVSYQMPQRSHTGYLLVASKAPDGELELELDAEDGDDGFEDCSAEAATAEEEARSSGVADS